MTANPASPRETNDSTGTKLGYYLYNDGGTATAAFARVLNAAVVGTETHKSGSIAIASMVLHDAADVAAEGPVKIGGYASAAAPTSVSADADRVAAWFLRNGALAVVPTGGGGLAGILDDATFTPGTSGVVMAGFEADETATDSVDEGDGGAARMTLDRKVIVTLQPHTQGGLSTFMASGSDGSSILVATAQAVKASAGQLYGYYAYNPEAAVTFVHFYNVAAASVVVGTTNPLFTIQLPAGAAANLMFPHGVTFSNAGWSVAATTTAGGNTAPATGVSLVAWYM